MHCSSQVASFSLQIFPFKATVFSFRPSTGDAVIKICDYGIYTFIDQTMLLNVFSFLDYIVIIRCFPFLKLMMKFLTFLFFQTPMESASLCIPVISFSRIYVPVSCGLHRSAININLLGHCWPSHCGRQSGMLLWTAPHLLHFTINWPDIWARLNQNCRSLQCFFSGQDSMWICTTSD